jgi:glycosyltransferase involved in cell wall biosynthesis
MNILYCVPALYNPGGMERILTEKVNYLANLEGYNLFVFTTDQDNRPLYFKLDDRVTVHHSNLNFNQYFSCNFLEKYLGTKKLLRLYEQQLQAYIKKNSIDLIVSLGGKELEFLHRMKTNSAKICELHFSIDIRKQFILSRGNSPLYKLIGNYRRWQMIQQTKKLDQLVVLTKEDEEKLKLTHQNVTQIYNFSPLAPTVKAPLNQKKIVAVGKLDPQKGFDLLIEACRFIKNWDGWILEIYGQGPDEEQLRSKISFYELEKHIFLKGVTRKVEEVYHSASFYVLSSRFEGFPMVLLEAISFGLPIVSFDCATGPNEVIVNDDCGILVDDGNTEKLGEAIQRMISSREEREWKSERAFQKSKLFSKDEIMKQWTDLFESLVKN